jgi:hypothetical protein
LIEYNLAGLLTDIKDCGGLDADLVRTSDY